MESSGELLKLMNGCMKTSTVASTMMAMSKEMFKAGVMAVSIEHALLTPGASTSLFVIRESGRDD